MCSFIFYRCFLYFRLNVHHSTLLSHILNVYPIVTSPWYIKYYNIITQDKLMELSGLWFLRKNLFFEHFKGNISIVLSEK
jgi:hypothetical protein